MAERLQTFSETTADPFRAENDMEQNSDCRRASELNGVSLGPEARSTVLELGIFSSKSNDSNAIVSTFRVTHGWASSETALIAAYLIAHPKRYEWWSGEASECLQYKELYWAACGWRLWRAEIDARWEMSSRLKAKITYELANAFGTKMTERLLHSVDWHQLARHILLSCDHRPIPLIFRGCRWLRLWGRELWLRLKAPFSFDTES